MFPYGNQAMTNQKICRRDSIFNSPQCYSYLVLFSTLWLLVSIWNFVFGINETYSQYSDANRGSFWWVFEYHMAEAEPGCAEGDVMAEWCIWCDILWMWELMLLLRMSWWIWWYPLARSIVGLLYGVWVASTGDWKVPEPLPGAEGTSISPHTPSLSGEDVTLL